MASNEFDTIPSYEPLPSSGGGEGFGVSEDDLTIVKAAEITGQPIAILGYIIQPNAFKENETDPDEVVLYEFMDPSGKKFGFWHTSNVLKGQVKERHERNEIPFKTVLDKVPPKKKGRNPYYSFA